MGAALLIGDDNLRLASAFRPALGVADANFPFREDAATAVPPTAAAPITAVPKKFLRESFKFPTCPLSLVIVESPGGALIKNVDDSQL
jgi:hypothetical protein